MAGNIKCYFCEGQNVTLLESINRKNHVVNYHHCSDCQKNFKTFEIYNVNIKENVCESCGEIFVTATNNKKYCDFCNPKLKVTRDNFKLRVKRKEYEDNLDPINSKKIKDMKKELVKSKKKLDPSVQVQLDIMEKEFNMLESERFENTNIVNMFNIKDSLIPTNNLSDMVFYYYNFEPIYMLKRKEDSTLSDTTLKHYLKIGAIIGFKTKEIVNG